jgi:hypothetical protein
MLLLRTAAIANNMEERFRALLLLLFLSLLLSAHGSLRTLQVSIHPMKPPITQPFDPNLALSPDLPSTDTRVVKKAAGCDQPEQVCVLIASCITNLRRSSGVPETHTGYILQHPVNTLSLHAVTLLMSPRFLWCNMGINSNIFATDILQDDQHSIVLVHASCLSCGTRCISLSGAVLLCWSLGHPAMLC